MVVLFAAPPGYVPRCFAASARDPRRPAQNVFVCWCTPSWRDNSAPSRRGFAGPLFDHNSRRLPGQRTAAAAAAAGGSRSAARPDADHGDPPTTAPRAPTACLAHTHRLARLLPGAGRSSPYQPHECQLAIPPQRERGSGLIPNCAGHQAVDYSRGAPRRRSLKPGRRPRQRASNETPGRPPAAAPTAAHRTPAPPRQTVPSPLAAEHAQPENSLRQFLAAD